jgi:hypothetical protein
MIECVNVQPYCTLRSLLCLSDRFSLHIYSGKLEKELQFLFGEQLRAAGGNGTLTLSEFLSATLGRTGKRAVVM